MKKYILALDQGTTTSRSIVFDDKGTMISISQHEFNQIYPKPGFVEHDPLEILNTQLLTIKQVIEKANISYDMISAIGITNQRETTVIWEKSTGKPIYNAIVWQCRRTSDMCKELKNSKASAFIHEKTGLIVDAYFSATKIRWILDNIPNAQEKAENGELLFGTIDSWLLWNLTGGIHATDYTNASRTMLFNINTLTWDEELLKLFNIPLNILPKVYPSSYRFGFTKKELFGKEIPISGIAGDQHAALFGQACFNEGDAKNTYGTGCFILMNTGDKPIMSAKGLITTVGWGLDNKDKEITYALEGSVFVAGAVLKWLRDELGIIKSSHEADIEAEKVPDNGGVYFVPAFTGLGAPYWDMDARGSISGLTRGTTKRHIMRAALESIAYQSYDVLKVMCRESNITLKELKVDGGASKSDFLMQFQSDLLEVLIDRPENIESTAQGAAFLAGLAEGIWQDKTEIKNIRKTKDIFKNKIEDNQRKKLIEGWHKAIKKELTQL